MPKFAKVERLLILSESAGSFLGTSIPDHLAANAGRARDLLPGTRLRGRYTVERVLGKGGFATVYKARDMTLARKPVVIKILDWASPGDTALQGAFDSELEALSRIAHPNVVGISDLGRLEDGTPFLVLQFVEGITRFQKLPKWVDRKLATATPAQLEEWGDRFVEKKSLAAIFGRE